MQQNSLINALRSQDKAIQEIRQGLMKLEYELGIKSTDRSLDPNRTDGAAAIKAINVTKANALDEIHKAIANLTEEKHDNEKAIEIVKNTAKNEVNLALESRLQDAGKSFDEKLQQSVIVQDQSLKENLKRQEEAVAHQIAEFKKQLLSEYASISSDLDGKLNSIKEILNKTKESNIELLESRIKQAEQETKNALNDHLVVLREKIQAEERSSFKFEDIKNIVTGFFEETKEEFTKVVSKKAKHMIKNELNGLINEAMSRELPKCNVRVVNYEEDPRGSAIKIEGGITSLELENGFLSVDKYTGLICNDTCISNTVDDHDYLAVISSDSKYHGEDLKGRYVDFVDIDEQSLLFTVTLNPNNDSLTSKVIAVVKEVIPDCVREVVYKHKIIKLEEGVEYAVIATQGISEVRCKDDKVKTGELLVPNGDGLYTNQTTTNRFIFTNSNCIPKVRVLKVLNEDFILGLISC